MATTRPRRRAAPKGGHEASARTSGPKSASRALWKGAISFGLVHVPVALHTATHSSDVDFDWIHRKTMSPVGYKRIDKSTGKEVDAEDIVRGVAVDRGRYVVLGPEEIAAAFPRTTRTVEIEAFVDAGEIPFVHYERPYYLVPDGRSAPKVYALLREALLAMERVAVGRVVIHAKQHLAIVVPSGRALILNLLRWGEEIRPIEWLELPPAGTKAAGLKPAELAMARRVIEDMTARWNPDDYRDSFKDRIMALVDAKSGAGDVETVGTMEDVPDKPGAEVIDLTELLKQSLGRKATSKVPSRARRSAGRARGRAAAAR